MYTSQVVHAFIHWLFTLCDVERQWFYTALWLRESGSLDLGERVSGSGRVCLLLQESVSPTVLATFCFHNPVVCSFTFHGW